MISDQDRLAPWSNKPILYYESGSGYGGSAVSLYRLIKYLDRKSFQPFVLVHGIGPRIEAVRKMGVSVKVLRTYQPMSTGGLGCSFVKSVVFYSNFILNTLVNALVIAKLIKLYNIRLVHLNNGILENFPALIAAKLRRIPCVSHIRGTEPLTKIDRTFGAWVDKVITLNSVMNNLYTSHFGANKSCIIFNGVDLDIFKNANKGKLKNDYQTGDNSFLVGTIARLVYGKGIPEFIKAAAEVIKVNRNVFFFIVGDDPSLNRSFENEMRQLVAKLHIEDRVVFTGWCNDVIDVMSDLDLIVQVSTYPEGMSLTPIEAMALGKPVITSDVPGYTDTVEHGVTGFIVPSGNTATLAKEIIKLTQDRHLAKQLGNNGRQKVLKEFDARIYAKNVQNIYDGILEKHSTAPPARVKVSGKEPFLGIGKARP